MKIRFLLLSLLISSSYCFSHDGEFNIAFGETHGVATQGYVYNFQTIEYWRMTKMSDGSTACVGISAADVSVGPIYIFRHMNDGTLVQDTTTGRPLVFSPRGINASNITGFSHSTTSGNIFLAANVWDTSAQHFNGFVYCMNPSLTAAAGTFASGGLLSFNDRTITQMVLDAGHIQFCGIMHSSGNLYVARYSNTGMPDASFGTGGIVEFATYDYLQTNQKPPQLIKSAGGFTLLCERKADHTIGLLELTNTGVPNATFGTAGFAALPSSADILPAKIISQNIAGSTYTLCAGIIKSENVPISGTIATPGLALCRFSSSGSFDNTFGTAGTAKIHAAGGYGLSPVDLTIDNRNRIIVVGNYFNNAVASIYHKPFVARFSSYGSTDTSFATLGLFAEEIWSRISPSANYEGICNDVMMDENGNILLCGSSKMPAEVMGGPVSSEQYAAYIACLNGSAADVEPLTFWIRWQRVIMWSSFSLLVILLAFVIMKITKRKKQM